MSVESVCRQWIRGHESDVVCSGDGLSPIWIGFTQLSLKFEGYPDVMADVMAKDFP